MMHRHEPGGLHVLALLADSLALARERQLCRELGGAGGVHSRGVVPDLLTGGQVGQRAVQPQPRAILNRLHQRLQLHAELALFGVFVFFALFWCVFFRFYILIKIEAKDKHTYQHQLKHKIGQSTESTHELGWSQKAASLLHGIATGS